MPEPGPLLGQSELDDLVAEYVYQTMCCSVWGHMRKMPAYAAIQEAGADAIPALLRRLASPEGAGMAVMHALAQAAGEWPEYEQVTDDVAPGFVGFRVSDARDAWLRWGREKGYLDA